MNITHRHKNTGPTIGEDFSWPCRTVGSHNKLTEHQCFDKHRREPLELGAMSQQLCMLHPRVWVLYESHEIYTLSEPVTINKLLELFSVSSLS